MRERHYLRGVGRGSSRLQLAAVLLILVAIIRVVEVLPLIALATASGTGSIVRAIAFYVQFSLAFHVAFIVTVLVIALGLLLRRQGTYGFVVTHNALILSVFSVMCFVSFTIGALVSSGLFVIAILSLIHPEARKEAEEADYERPPLEAAMRVIHQRRQFRESAPPAVAENDAFAVKAPSRSQLCPECDGLNPEGVSVCRHCGSPLRTSI